MTMLVRPPQFGQGLDRGALWNAFLALAASNLPLVAGQSALRFEPATAPLSEELCLWVSVDGAAPPLIVVIRAFPFRTLFDVNLSVADLAALPDGLREALRQGMRETLRGMLPETLGRRLTVVSEGSALDLARNADADTEWLSLRLEQQAGEGKILDAELLLGWPRRLIVGELGHALLDRAPLAASLSTHLVVPADMTIGTITLGIAEMQRLEPGAVVVLAESKGEALTLRVGDVAFSFAETDEGCRCLGPRTLDRNRPRAAFLPKETSMDDHTTFSEAPPEAEFRLGDLQIAVDFDLGRSMVPLSVVSGWTPGQIVDIAPPTLADGVEVVIRCNGDIVGRGDLVRIDDRIAVRITRFDLSR